MNEKNFRIATNNSNDYCTIIENTCIPLNKITLWNVKILKSKKNDGGDILIGIAPNDINQSNEIDYNICGW